MDDYNVSSRQIHGRLVTLVNHERRTTERIIKHFEVVERKRIFARLGYGSMFEYATKALKYSDSSAVRRINAARAGKALPKIYDYLRTGEINLSTLDLTSDLLRRPNGESLLESIRGKSQREVKEITAVHRPVTPEMVRDVIQPIVVKEVSMISDENTINHLNEVASVNTTYHRSEVQSENTRYHRSEVPKHHISFAVGDEFMEKLRRVKELMFRGEELSLESVFGEALEEYVTKHCPKKRAERREAREKGCESKRLYDPRSRRVPVWLRDEVLKRDGYQCTFVGELGKRCSCRVDLELDHIVSFAKGGLTTAENLRVVCSQHNLTLAIQTYGEEFMEGKIAAAGAR